MDDARFLKWTVDEAGLRLVVEAAGVQVPASTWALEPIRTTGGAIVDLAVLLELHNASADAQPAVDDAALRLSHAEVAALTPGQLNALGLPEPLQHVLVVRRDGLPRDGASFGLSYGFRTAAGLSVRSMSRRGAIVSLDGVDHVLPGAAYGVAERIDEFRVLPPGDQWENWRRLGVVHELLSPGIQADMFVQEIKIVTARSVALDVRQSDPDGINPVLVLKPSEAESEGNVPAPQLPPERQGTFEAAFAAHDAVRPAYAVKDGWYVLIEPTLRSALEVLKTKQAAPPTERRAFLLNARAALRAALGDRLSDPELELVFQETPDYLSNRIKCLGHWEPKLGVFAPWGTQSWLPKDIVHLEIEGGLHPIALASVPSAIEAIREAMSGQASESAATQFVSGEGYTLPATTEALRALEKLHDGMQEVGIGPAPGPEPDPVDDASAGTSPAAALVPVIYDNVDDAEFVAQAQARGPIVEQPRVPGTVRTSLLQHQRRGLHWLEAAWSQGLRGVLLADDMGLGKTLQVLAFMAWLREERGVACRPMLVVAPSGLLRNWEEEAERHLEARALGRPVLAHGPALRALRDLVGGSGLRVVQELQSSQWVLTTYETLRDHEQIFRRVEWDVIAFDEAQKIKNPSSLLTEMAKAMATEFAIALTGTPVENRLADLWCIADAVHPGLLGSYRKFVDRYERAEGEDLMRGLRDLHGRLTHEAVGPFMLRRTKASELQGLPPRLPVRRCDVPMSARQAQLYDQIVLAARGRSGDAATMLSTLHALRQLSLSGATEGHVSDADLVEDSARLKATLDVLDEIRDRGEKALVFVEFRRMQAQLQPLLQRRYGLAKLPAVINGEMDGVARSRQVTEFQAGAEGSFDVMLLSPRAGGLGLTLTAANHVIHLTRWWNPAIEDQCNDRVYRIGQTRPVNIYIPLARHPMHGEQSFDFVLDGLLERKRALCQAILLPPEASRGDLEELFKRVIGAPAVRGDAPPSG